MPQDDQRDRSIERMLRQGAAAAGARQTSADCVDAEMVAAWTAGALRHAEATRVEHHVADCARCQAMLAVFARTEPAAPVHGAWWRRRDVRWLVPLATAATIAGIWVAIPERDVAVREPLPAVEAPRAEPLPAPQPAPTSPPARPPESQIEAAEKRSTSRADTQPQRDQSRTPIDRLRTSPPPAASAPKPPQALQETVTATAERPRGEQAATRVVEVVSPDDSTRWRILRGSQVERSTDGGARWQPLALPSPAMLTAGHSPSPSIAWLVGRAGTIFVTTDGSRFERVPFVEGADVVSVVAVDGRQATVTTADGRQFSTADRGATWTRR
jgi:hypothetical protein